MTARISLRVLHWQSSRPTCFQHLATRHIEELTSLITAAHSTHALTLLNYTHTDSLPTLTLTLAKDVV